MAHLSGTERFFLEILLAAVWVVPLVAGAALLGLAWHAGRGKHWVLAVASLIAGCMMLAVGMGA